MSSHVINSMNIPPAGDLGARKAVRIRPVEGLLIVAFVIMFLGFLAIGRWMENVILERTLQEVVATTAKYLESLVSLEVAGMDLSSFPNPQRVQEIGAAATAISQRAEMVGVKLWGAEGRILFSNDPALEGLVFSGSPEKAAAWQGELSWRVTPLDDYEHRRLRETWSRLLEIFCPLRDGATGSVIAVVEFYHSLDQLEASLRLKRQTMWLLLAAIGIPMYALLAIAARRTSRTIWTQERELHRRVRELGELLEQNRNLHRQIRMAAAHATALNERFRQRTSAELHDGPVQDISYALLQVDRLDAVHARCSAATTDDCCELESRLDDIRSALSLAVDELRRLAADFSGVDLAAVSPEAALRKAVERHLKRTETPVHVEISEMPEDAPLSTKITLFRVVQESLQNAFRHADGRDQRVRAWSDKSSIWVEVSDRGPGFDVAEAMAREDCLGLTGLRDRVSILGGRFRVDSDPASGTRVVACLPRVPGAECPDA